MDDDTGALPPKQDFSGWFNDLLWRAGIMDVRYPVKGLYVWYPYGFAIRKFVYNGLRELLDRDHQETLFPLLIPEQEFMKEAEHIKGFENEVYWVTHGGTTPLDVKLALRPTSETAIYPMYALWLRSHADLPMKYYQIVNTFRYETKQTRPLIRLREITSFMESHTVHATWDEAEAQVEYELGLTKEFYDGLCIPITISKRPDWDKFPGADYTIAVDAIMPNGRTLQIGTVHHLGTHFSKTFSIKYEDKNGEQQLANQTCYGISERCIAALISLHGDDKGLILPPAVAPVQAVIVPITIGKRHEDVLAAAQKLEADLKAAGFRVKTDIRDMRPGAKYYWWELRGVPLRLELGPRDLDGGKVMAVKRTGEKSQIELATVTDGVTRVLGEITEAIRVKAEEHTKAHLCSVDSMEALNAALNEGKVAVVHWCRERGCGDAIEEKANSSILGTEVRSLYVPCTDGCCIVCGNPGKATLVGRTY
ncbi:proline--tRNA ligase [Methanoregula sp.]|jgi:prolyl-tRNA synthetase|uniref:proline--tRNA ligase n=1 Tax=Methanoregula sp. TaxID=2052170 RepID=UPI003C168151